MSDFDLGGELASSSIGLATDFFIFLIDFCKWFEPPTKIAFVHTVQLNRLEKYPIFMKHLNGRFW